MVGCDVEFVLGGRDDRKPSLNTMVSCFVIVRLWVVKQLVLLVW